MDETIIVLVSDKDDSKHGEISILDDPQKAERLVETLLEAGFDESRIRVFNGRSSEFQISHRPVVALVDGSGDGARRLAAEGKSRNRKAEEPAAAVENREGKAEEPTAQAEPREGKVEEPAAAVENREGKAEERAADVSVAQSRSQEPPEDGVTEEAEAPATAESAAPVKFSPLFRSA
ncbi:MAG: hypothetical protein IIC87_01500 [Chloroflexi bacterium]|nr:hypothetical protein [Chloroflexota bacterium]